MRTIWDVSAQRDNEETEAGRGVGHNQLASDTWDPDTFGTQARPGKTAINRGQMGDDRNGKSQTEREGPQTLLPGFRRLPPLVAFLLLPP